MQHARILIKEKSDPTPALSEVKVYSEGELKDVVLLEGGMSSGKTSIALHVVDGSGRSVIVQTSAAMFEMIFGALKGAEIRWSERAEHKCVRCKVENVPSIGMVCGKCFSSEAP